MSEPHSEQSIDWSKVDLLDACYDPMLQGMGLDGSALLDATGWDLPIEISSVPENQIASLERSGRAETQLVQYPTMGDLGSNADESIFCSTCEMTFGDWNKLNWHAQSTLHLAFPCDSPNCNEAFSSSWQLQEHRSKPHVLVHANVAGLAPFVCMECLEQCQGKVDLLRHAKQHQHRPYACQCGSRFSRSDVLDRHLKSFGTDEPKHPCKYCKRHRGPQGFKRLDHLMQHIRNYHHHDRNDGLDGGETSRSWTTYNFPVCTHSDCPQYRDESFKRLPRAIQKQNKPFDSQSAYTKHMREEHNDSTFPCDVLGCQRVGRKGYFREKDLLRHRSGQHPEAPPYQVQIREWKIRCTEVGCNAVLSPTFIRDHMHFYHRRETFQLYSLQQTEELKLLSSVPQYLQPTQSLENLDFLERLGDNGTSQHLISEHDTTNNIIE